MGVPRANEVSDVSSVTGIPCRGGARSRAAPAQSAQILEIAGTGRPRGIRSACPTSKSTVTFDGECKYSDIAPHRVPRSHGDLRCWAQIPGQTIMVEREELDKVGSVSLVGRPGNVLRRRLRALSLRQCGRLTWGRYVGIDEFFRRTNEARPLVVPDTGAGLFVLARRCLRICPVLPAHGRLIIVVRVAEGTQSRRIGRLLFLRPGRALLQRMLVSSGLRVEGWFAVVPDIKAPRLIYRLGGAAERYSQEHLVWNGGSRLRRLLRTLVSAVSGCDPSVGAVVMIASRRDT